MNKIEKAAEKIEDSLKKYLLAIENYRDVEAQRLAYIINIAGVNKIFTLELYDEADSFLALFFVLKNNEDFDSIFILDINEDVFTVEDIIEYSNLPKEIQFSFTKDIEKEFQDLYFTEVLNMKKPSYYIQKKTVCLS